MNSKNDSPKLKAHMSEAQKKSEKNFSIAALKTKYKVKPLFHQSKFSGSEDSSGEKDV